MADEVCFYGRSYERQDGCLYVRVRAISAIVNLNYDGWPSSELEKSYQTFIGKPVFVDHHSEDKGRARGVILDSEFLRTDDDAWVELLLEIDGEAFPMLAHELVTGGLDSTSMGAIVNESECSVCGAVSDGTGNCEHIPYMKGQTVFGQLVYEICRDITFYEISLVFDPADVTALAKQVVASAPKASAVSRLSAAPPAYAAQSWSPVSLDNWGSGAPAIDAAPYSAPFAEPDEDEDSEEDKLFDSDEYLFFDLSNDALLAAEEIDDDLI